MLQTDGRMDGPHGRSISTTFIMTYRTKNKEKEL